MHMFFKLTGRAFIFVVLLALLLHGLFTFIFLIESQKCEMTYMFDYPIFKPINIDNKLEKFQNYGIYNYLEENDIQNFNGIPVIFIPGNAGSYRQVRSLASVSKEKSKNLKQGHSFLFNYFTIDFAEELSAFNGNILRNQLEFLYKALNTIQKLYPVNRSVILVGHSMGGFLAKALVSSNKYPNVKVIVALGSPLEIPVIGSDYSLIDLYKTVNRTFDLNQQNVVMISLTGGNRDILVGNVFGRDKYALWIPTTSLKQVEVATDHLCIVWCRQVVLSINRLLYSSLDNLHSNFNRNSFLKLVQHHFFPKLSDKIIRNSNYSVSSYLELYFNQKMFELKDSSIFAIELPVLYSLTRPIRFQMHSKDCLTQKSKALLIDMNNNHTHTFHIFDGVPIVLQSHPRPSNENHYPIILQIEPSNQCDSFQIYFSVHISDWIANLIRYNAMRFVCCIIVWHLISLPTCFHQSYHYAVMTTILFTSLIGCEYLIDLDFNLLLESRILDRFDLIFIMILSWPMYCIIDYVAHVFLLVTTVFNINFRNSKLTLVITTMICLLIVAFTQEIMVVLILSLIHIIIYCVTTQQKKEVTVSVMRYPTTSILCLIITQSLSFIGLIHQSIQRNSLWKFLLQRVLVVPWDGVFVLPDVMCLSILQILLVSVVMYCNNGVNYEKLCRRTSPVMIAAMLLMSTWCWNKACINMEYCSYLVGISQLVYIAHFVDSHASSSYKPTNAR